MNDSILIARTGKQVALYCDNSFSAKLLKEIIRNVIANMNIDIIPLMDAEPENPEPYIVFRDRQNREQQEKLNKEKYKDERYSIEYCVWRDAVYDKANRTCEDCGKKPKKIHAHHVLGWVDNPDKRYSVDNGKCLCIPCHIKYHPWMKKEFKENE